MYDPTMITQIDAAAFDDDNGKGPYGFVDGLGNHYNLLELLRGPTVIDMTEDGCGCFFLVFKDGKPSHWVGDSGVEKDMEEMVEFITDELTGEFKFTKF